MVGGGDRVVAARVRVGPKHAGDSGVPACRFLYIALGACINRRSERAGGLHFES